MVVLNPLDGQKKSEEKPKEPEGVAILIDGNNFYKSLEFLGFHDISNFHFDDFIKFLARGRKIVFSRYYKGRLVREPDNVKSEKMYSDQQRLFANLENSGIKVEKGQMIKRQKYKKCKGFYPISRIIESKIELKEIAEAVLSDHKTIYKPIILITPEFPFLEQLEKGKLKEFAGIYLLSNEWGEKGVDVKIAVDILTLAGDKNCQSIIFVSSDSDLLPAIKKAQEIGKTIEYIGFGDGCYYSPILFQKCRGRLLIKEDIKPFFPPNLFDLKA